MADHGHDYGGKEAPTDDHVNMQTDPGHGGRPMATVGRMIDENTGRAPVRVTDCICLFLFFIYVGLIMVALPLNAATNGNADLNRISYGVDSFGRVCGQDADVQEKKYLYWCRKDATESSATPTGLDLERPACVSKCPEFSTTASDQIDCLQGAKIVSAAMPPSGNILAQNVVIVTERRVMTVPYDTSKRAGRFCVPDDEELQAQVLHHGQMLRLRFYNLLTSLWPAGIWILLTMLVTCLLSYIFLLALRFAAKPIIFVSNLAGILLFFVGGLFFLGSALASSIFHVSTDFNPLFQRNTKPEALLLSCGFAVILFWFGILAIRNFRQLTSTENGQLEENLELLHCANECLWQMSCPLLIQPMILSLIQLALIAALIHGLMVLISQGDLAEHRIRVDEQDIEGLSRVFHQDEWSIGWSIFLYVLGSLWCIEFTISLGQFLTGFAVISWYFVEKQDEMKVAPPAFLLVREQFISVLYHLGSICLGSFCIIFARVFRTMFSLIDVCGCFIFPCLRCCGFGQDPFCTWLTAWESGENFFCMQFGWIEVDHCNKDVYNDVIIRATDFFPAVVRSKIIFGSVPAVARCKRKSSRVTQVGVFFVPVFAMLAYIGFMHVDAVNDEASNLFIPDPIAVGWFTLILGMLVAYNFFMIVDHTADTLLYSYAWHKRHKKGTICNYIPESLRYVVGWDDMAVDKYPYYGRAKPSMYLSYYLELKKMAGGGGGGGDQSQIQPDQTSRFFETAPLLFSAK